MRYKTYDEESDPALEEPSEAPNADATHAESAAPKAHRIMRCQPCGAEGPYTLEGDEEDEDESEDEVTTWFDVRAREQMDEPTEQDDWRQRCEQLAQDRLRDRPTLPPYCNDLTVSLRDVSVAVRLPVCSCPFRDCVFRTENRTSSLLHVGGMYTGAPHWAAIQRACGSAPRFRASDWVAGAIACVERANFPRVGPATTRRALRRVTQVYSDDAIRALACFCCGQLRTTWAGPADIDYVFGVPSQARRRLKCSASSVAVWSAIAGMTCGAHAMLRPIVAETQKQIRSACLIRLQEGAGRHGQTNRTRLANGASTFQQLHLSWRGSPQD